MKSIVEHLELRKNNFSKWLSGIMAVLSILALYIALTDNKKEWRWPVAGLGIFCGMFYFSLTNKISVSQQGILVKEFFKEREIQWEDITSLNYHSSYHGHGVSLVLTISYGSPTRIVLIHVKQYNKDKMQRFFEMLNEQCPYAEKNEHFIKKATGVMGWKDKLKMY